MVKKHCVWGANDLSISKILSCRQIKCSSILILNCNSSTFNINLHFLLAMLSLALIQDFKYEGPASGLVFVAQQSALVCKGQLGLTM